MVIDFSYSRVFDCILGFGSTDFQVFSASTFIQDFLWKYFVEDNFTLALTLKLYAESTQCHWHTDLVLITGDACQRLFLHHPVSRPYGEKLTGQCECGTLNQLVHSKKDGTEADRVVLHCKGVIEGKGFCNKVQIYNAPEGFAGAPSAPCMKGRCVAMSMVMETNTGRVSK